MSKPGRIWFPLDANFTRDDRVVAAGDAAAILFLAILGHVKLSGAPGTIHRTTLPALGIGAWERRLARLLAVGLIEPSPGPGDVLRIAAWESWQVSRDRADYMREWRAKRKAADDPDP